VLSRGVRWFETDVSGLPIVPIFARVEMFQTTEEFISTAAEATILTVSEY
jgi:hypothetical protein